MAGASKQTNESERALVQKARFEDLRWPTNKSLLVAYLLWLPPFGILGLHRFYLKQKALGVLYFFTGGGFLLGWLRDLFTLPATVRLQNKIIAALSGKSRRELLKSLPQFENSERLAGVREDSGYWENGRGHELFYKSYLPEDQKPKAVIFQCVGYSMYNSWVPAGECRKLAKEGYAVYGIDYVGHGLSDGLHAYVNDFDAIADDTDRYFAKCAEQHPGLKCFLLGESMGGAMEIWLHFMDKKRDTQRYSGAVLMAPMVKISDDIKPPMIVERALRAIGRQIPLAPLVPSGDLTAGCVSDPEIVKEWRANPLFYGGLSRFGTANELLRVSYYCEANLEKVTMPFLVLHGSADVVTEPATSEALYKRASSEDKTFKQYEGQYHVLLLEPKHKEVFADIVEWYDARV